MQKDFFYLPLLMDNKELIYEMAKTLGLVIEVWKGNEFVGAYRFFDGKLVKIK